MLSFDHARRIFIARAATDMRKSFDTLAALVEGELRSDPLSGDVFVFVSKDRRRIKILTWDVSGFWLCAKRLESGRFAIAQVLRDGRRRTSIRLSPAQMHEILEGIDVHRATYRSHYHRNAASDRESKRDRSQHGV